MMLFDSITKEIKSSTPGRWYAALESRDQRNALLAGIVSLFLLFFVFLWMPLSTWAQAETHRYQNSQALLEWIKLNEPEARKLATSGDLKNTGKDSLLAVISRSARTSAITLLRFQEEGAGGVSVVLQDQVFNDVIRWLEQLEKKERIQVRQLSIDAHTQPGKINARIIFI
ncbi:MAG: type II secretion system protein M [Pseudomonadales bacterium]|nr:type II secretion system protein M [Pseudomonadales bacterium]